MHPPRLHRQVRLFDTMNGPPHRHFEVIENFGVAAGKVGVCAMLCWYSTDNLPGCPASAQTASQLMRLIWRPGRKMPSAPARSSIEAREVAARNAEKARISRQFWVLLDDKEVSWIVPLDEPLCTSPTSRKLIAFLKAMEFSTLTRRFADIPYRPFRQRGNEGSARGSSSSLPPLFREGSDIRHAVSPHSDPGAISLRPWRHPTPPSPASGERAHRASPGSYNSMKQPRATMHAAGACPPRRGRSAASDKDRSQQVPTIRSLEEPPQWIARVHDSAISP